MSVEIAGESFYEQEQEIHNDAPVVAIPTEANLEWQYAHFSPEELISSALSKQHKARIAQWQMQAIRKGYGNVGDNIIWTETYTKILGPVDTY